MAIKKNKGGAAMTRAGVGLGRSGLKTSGPLKLSGGLKTTGLRVGGLNGQLRKKSKGFGRKAHNELVDAINSNRVLPERGWQETPNGMMPPVPAAVLPYRNGFIVQGSDSGVITIGGDGSVVTGPDHKSRVPEIGGVGIDADTPPQLSVSDGDIVSIRIEVEPDTAEDTRFTPSIWIPRSTGITIGPSGDDTISIVATQADEAVANINQTTGAVDANAVFHIPLAEVERSGNDVSVKYKWYAEKGPIGCAYCETGYLSVWGSMVINLGDLQVFDDEP